MASTFAAKPTIDKLVAEGGDIPMTPADWFEVFSAGVRAAMSTAGDLTAGIVVVFLAFALAAALLRTANRNTAGTNRDEIRAYAQERLARREALAYDDEPPFTGAADWPARGEAK